MIDDWQYICRYCEQESEEFKLIPPTCECPGAQESRRRRLEEFKSSPDYQEPLENDEYEKKYPVTYSGERLVLDKDTSHKLKLQARLYDGGEGLCVWVPFPHKLDEESEEESEGSGLCWDFTDNDAKALHELLGEYVEGKKCR